MQDLNQENTQDPNGAPSPGLFPTSLSADQIRLSHEMLKGFREGVREGTFQGKHLTHIAQGLMFLDTMIGQSKGQLEMAKQREKEAFNRAKEEIKAAGGTIGTNPQ